MDAGAHDAHVLHAAALFLTRWDNELAAHPFTGVAANDAHQNQIFNGTTFDPYAVSFRHVSTHILARDLEIAANALVLGLCGDRSDHGVSLGPDLDSGNRLRQPLSHLVMDRRLDQQPASGQANLACVDGEGANRPGNGRCQIGVIKDDVRRLAAQLQGQGDDPFRRDLADLTAGSNASLIAS